MDIREGRQSVDLPEDARMFMQKLLSPNPERADALDAVMREFGSISSKEALGNVWPRFSLVSGWLNGPTGRDARQVMRRLPKKVGTFAMGYGSSEGKWNIPLKAATAEGAASPFSSIYEFRDLVTGRLYRASEVWPHKFYELVVTTYSGLVRYNMQDVVYVTGREGGSPVFAFCGKTSEVVRVNGRKRDSHNFLALFAWIEIKYDIEFDLMQVCEKDGELSFILESADDIDYARLLRFLNSIMGEHWGFTASHIYVVDSAYKQAYFDSKELPGRGVSGIKVPTVTADLPDTKFIKALVNKED